MNSNNSLKHLSVLGAWAFAFGCAIGSDVLILPWTTFLPTAGPLGSLLGLAAAAVIMLVVVWNFHYMINRCPGTGGVYSYATKAFGHDHGYLCAWFLLFAYAAIVCADATALMAAVRYMLGGDVLHFGFHYSIAGYTVCMGDVVIAFVAMCISVAFCLKRRVAGIAQSVVAVALAVGVSVMFVAALVRHGGGAEVMRPLFSPDGPRPVLQVLGVLSISPWLFIGVESISTMSAEFRFPLNRSFGIMAAATGATAVVYVFAMFIPILAGGDGSSWVDVLKGIADPEKHALDVARNAMGGFGTVVLGCTLAGALFSNLIGNTIVASRLVAAMADDGAMPKWLGRRNGTLSASNAIVVIAALAVVTSTLGQTVIGIIVDVAIVGVAIAYAYTSAATFKLARAEGNRLAVTTGLVGMVSSAVIVLLFLLPTFSDSNVAMGTASYLVLGVWCVAALACFIFIFRRDATRRFGRSPVVWTSLFLLILALSVLWVRQTANDTMRQAYDDISKFHSEKCLAEGGPGTQAGRAEDWHISLRRNLSVVRSTIINNSYAQSGLNVLALVLMVCFYKVLRRREHEMEEEKIRAKSYFFSTVSHDIRTPLNAIIGFSEMLKDGFKTEAERTQAIDSIVLSGKTLLGLVNDVLDLSKLESGKMVITPEPTDCTGLIHGLAEVFRVSNVRDGVELRCSIGDMPPLMLDPQRLRQIVFNLVGNAFKFTESGHVEMRASFDATAPDVGVFRFAVEDTGCGISERDLGSIGSAYVQVGSRVSRNGGTGLGLAICKELIAAMGGELHVESKLGEGSTFSVVIPGVKVAASDAVVKAAVGENAHVRPAGAFIVRRILVVDDSKMNLMVLKAHLKCIGGFEVVAAADGQEALEALSAPGAKPFDLVLTDMWMPRLDGSELVKAMRANPALAHTRTIVVTADVEFQSKYKDMGFDGILLKPITQSGLADILAGRGG